MSRRHGKDLQPGFPVAAADVACEAARWLTYLATERLTLNAYSGQESNRAADLLAGQIARNFVYAGNLQYRLGSNVLLGLEANQVRTTYVGGLLRLLNHYDLALAYLF